jgi:uncharacterized membrane protein YqhA
MTPINTVIIENFVDKVRIAKKTNKKSVELDIDSAQMLSDTLVKLIIRISSTVKVEDEKVSITADGGNF